MGIFRRASFSKKDKELATVVGRKSSNGEDETTSLLAGAMRSPIDDSQELRNRKNRAKENDRIFFQEDQAKVDDVVLVPASADWSKLIEPITFCKKERCEANHPLLPYDLWDFTKENGPVCSMCSKYIGFEEVQYGLLSCRTCDWDVCPDCNARRTD